MISAYREPDEAAMTERKNLEDELEATKFELMHASKEIATLKNQLTKKKSIAPLTLDFGLGALVIWIVTAACYSEYHYHAPDVITWITGVTLTLILAPTWFAHMARKYP